MISLVNLSLAELMGLFAVAGGLTVALYLLTRARKQFVVSTLRFWQAAADTLHQTRRRRIDQPWSLLLQLLALLLLLLAVAQPRLGSPQTRGLDHVLVLDTSAWMGALSSGGDLASEAREASLSWLRSLPSQDRVMVIRANTLPSPATAFEFDRGRIQAAIRNSQPMAGRIDLQQAFALAAQSQRLESASSSRAAGDIVFAGAARINARDAESLERPANLRVLPIKPGLPNVGITRATVTRPADDPAVWRAAVTVRNFSPFAQNVPAVLGFGGAPAGSRLLPIPPRSEVTSSFVIPTRVSGILEIRLNLRDALASDNRVFLQLPSQPVLRVALNSSQPELLRPLLAGDPRIAIVPAADADFVVFDRVAPPTGFAKPAIYLQPPAAGSPVPTEAGSAKRTITRWNTTHPATFGVRVRDLQVDAPYVLKPANSDTVLADSEGRPLIVARNSPAKSVVFAFQPLLSPMRFELAMPLLFADILQWVSPDSFARREILATGPGAVSFDIDEVTDPSAIRVVSEDGNPVPFTVDAKTLRFFSPVAQTVRVVTPGSERLFSLTLPGIGEADWEAPASTPRGPAAPRPSSALPRDLWRWLAIAAALLLAVEYFLYGSASSRWSWLEPRTVLKLVAIAAVIAALLEPAFSVPETKLAVGVLADTSGSLSDQDLARVNSIVAGLSDARGRHILRIFPFARQVRTPDAAELASGLKRTAGDAGRATDIESAIRDSAASLPAGLVPRLVLISDGRETSGASVRAAWLSRQLNIPIDTISLEGRPVPRLRLDHLRFPSAGFTGERIPFDLTVTSPEPGDAVFELSAEGKAIGSTAVRLVAGENRIQASASVATAGAIDVSGVLRAGPLGELRFEQILSLRRPKLLYLTGDAPGMGSHLLQSLTAAQFEVTESRDISSARFGEYQVVALNNWDLESMADSRKADLERFVQQGGGLLVIGGVRNIYIESPTGRKNLDPLERALPATIAPPRTPEGTSVILIVDKSSSMEGRKMELARLAAIGVVENLRPVDFVGILIFDNSHQWAVPLRRAEDKTLIKRLIAGITPDGGTQIAPALAEAFRRMLAAGGAYKHIVLLTDGISEEGDSANLAREAANQRITISTVGLGQDVNKLFLEKVALNAKGKAYFLTDPSGLEQILIKDVKEHTGSTTVEKSIRPNVVRKAEIFEGLDLAAAPDLKGFVRFEAKPAADLLLSLNPDPGSTDKPDPLLARWQYGLGRTAVFASDAKPRWAEDWVSWNGYDRFWANVLRDLLPHAQPLEATLTHDPANRSLVAEYRLARASDAPAKPPTLYCIGPAGFQQPVELESAGEAHYRASIPIGDRTGAFRLRPVVESRTFPEIGIHLPEPEISSYGSNKTLLQQLAAYTGGRFNPSAADVFAPTGRVVASSLRLWPFLLAIAILCNLAELAMRKLQLGPKRRTASAVMPSPSNA